MAKLKPGQSYKELKQMEDMDAKAKRKPNRAGETKKEKKLPDLVKKKKKKA